MTTLASEAKFKITGMDCAGCARSIETGVSQLDGVSTCELNFTTETLRVTGRATSDVIEARVRALGFEATDIATSNVRAPQPAQRSFINYLLGRQEMHLVMIGTVLLLASVILEAGFAIDHVLNTVLAIGAVVIAGWPVARSAWQSIRVNRDININVLMTIAAIGAVFIGEVVEAGAVVILFGLGEAIEGFAASRARDSIRSLMQVMPSVATRLIEREDYVVEEAVDVQDLQIGDVIIVKPGDRIPMDGRVVEGASSVSQAAITGESSPVVKHVDSDVFASSINGEGALKIEVTHLAQDNTISRMIALVEAAQERRAPAQRFIDRFARYYTPAVVLLAILVAAIPPLLFGQPFFNPGPDTTGWLYRGLALLIVACPCALVISTPVSIVSAISNAAKNGVLVKGGAYLEQLSRIKVMAFDKTGTLTTGKPAVVSIRAVGCEEPHGVGVAAEIDCNACDDLIALADAVERRSEHPLAFAITNESIRRGVQTRYPSAESVTALTGRGIRGRVAAQEVTVGSHNHFEDTIPHTEDYCDAATNAAAKGYTPMMVSADGNFLGTIAVADTVRASSRDAIARLKGLGMRALVMLTGDNTATAERIAADVGVTDVRAELLPEDKVAAVEALRAEHGSIAMVGDGINDAPALATADLGIAIGGASGGTAQAMETADITLMRDGLHQLPFAVSLSHAMMQTIRVNVALSLGIKLLFLIAVLFGWGTMWLAVLADMGTSLLVTANGARLLRRG